MNPTDKTTFSSEVRKAVEVLRKGGVILYPTDTVWGLGCDATNPEAVRRLYEIKRCAPSKAALVLVDSEAALERWVKTVPEAAWMLIDVADKPLTIIYDHPLGIAPALLADDGSLGIRLTREPFSAALCRDLRRPIVSTSANFSGESTPRSYADITEELKSMVDYVVDFRREERNLPSPSGIIKVSDSGVIRIIR